MNILVCISKTPETTAKISFKDNNTAYDETGVQFIMNPYDEWYALVRALELKEQVGGTVTILNVGTSANDAIIRKGLAIGADKAVRIDAEPKSTKFVAKNIAEYVKNNSFDIIFTGKETIDYNSSLIGGLLAGYLDMPFISYASHMEWENDKATISRDIEGGVEVLEVAAPFVISASKGLAEQRIPNMRGIMMAKRKPLEVVPATAEDSGTAIKSYRKPAEKGEVKMVDPEKMDELVRLLKEEAKVL